MTDFGPTLYVKAIDLARKHLEQVRTMALSEVNYEQC